MRRVLQRLQAALVVCATPVIALAASTCLVPININFHACQTECSSFVVCPAFGECMNYWAGASSCGAAYQTLQCTYYLDGYLDENKCCTGGIQEFPIRTDGGYYTTLIAVPLGDPCVNQDP